MNNINKMRPSDIHNKALLLREKSGVEFYLHENNSFVDINCPACGIYNSITSFYKYGFKHEKCKECNTLYVSPRPPEYKLFEYYDNYEAPKFWTEVLSRTNDDRKYLQHIPRVKLLKRVIEKNSSPKTLFVELGAGNGNFAKAIKEESIFDRVLATDISSKCVLACQEQKLETRQCTIEDFEENSIDSIAFNDLIEHVFNPCEFLKHCYFKLKENGVLMLSTPNGEGFDFKILKDKTENITPPEHIQYFNPNSIRVLLERVGFKIIDISTPGILDVDIIKRQINEKEFDLTQNNEFLDFVYSLDNNNIENSFQEFLQKNNLSSHMLIFAKKKL
jgi:SAM-dependent methyltransferase